MNSGLFVLLGFPATLLVAGVCLPDGWVHRRIGRFRQGVTWVAGLQVIVALSFLLAHTTGSLHLNRFVLARFANEFPIEITIYYDGLAALMLALVSFVGWVICGYSIRYLDGDANQARYFRWTAFTIGAVSWMVISGNLLMFVGTWIMTSLGLHRLLLHYGHRPAARRAAWTKFAISRIGDVALIATMVLLYTEFHTLDFTQLFAIAGALPSVSTATQTAGFLLVAGAVTKSAQFPFHTWLPQTMETPTPVSALMHAGIVNAGGYLILRTMPLVSLTPWAMALLAIIGGFTACFGAVVMTTQTSVKKSLAYSTIAQMGFMLLQCGLGAVSAALLHILAHSLYKAHAFLSSGSVIAETAPTAAVPATVRPFATTKLVIIGAVMIVFLGGSFAVVGIDPFEKPGGVLLGGCLCLALTSWIGQVMRTDNPVLMRRALAVAGGLCIVYAASFLMVDRLAAASLPVSAVPGLAWIVAAIVLIGFMGMFALQTALASVRGRALVNRWQIHAANGFYFENMLRRIFEPLLNN